MSLAISACREVARLSGADRRLDWHRAMRAGINVSKVIRNRTGFCFAYPDHSRLGASPVCPEAVGLDFVQPLLACGAERHVGRHAAARCAPVGVANARSVSRCRATDFLWGPRKARPPQIQMRCVPTPCALWPPIGKRSCCSLQLRVKPKSRCSQAEAAECHRTANGSAKRKL
jgi:hypothetical protein